MQVNSSKPVLSQNRFDDEISMRKALFKTPAVVFGNLKKNLHNKPDLTKLNRIAEQFHSLFDQRSSLTESRKTNSALIGKARKNGDDFQALLHSSKELSRQLNNANSQMEALVEEVMAMFGKNASTFHKNSSDLHAEGHENTSLTGPGQFLPLAPSDSRKPVEVFVSSTNDAQRWNDYVAGNTHATHYHQYQWRGIIERNFAQTSWYFIAENANGEIVGVAASVHMDSRIFGSFMLSMPFLIYGGPIGNDQQISRALATHISTVADQNGCSHTELRETHPREDWHELVEKVSMVLELPHTPEILNKRLGSKIRAQIKRAATEQPEILLGSSELIPEFYAVFTRKMRDHGTPVYAMEFFQDMASTFPQSTHVAVVRLKGKPVAAAFLISYRDTLEIPWAASIRKFDRLGMNMFMYHALLEQAVKRGFKYFDFGRSTRGASTWSFKKQWGARERQLYWHFQSKGTLYDPGTGGSSAKFALAVSLWKRLPLSITNRLGPMVAKKLPW